jgi:hypothetical protein
MNKINCNCNCSSPGPKGLKSKEQHNRERMSDIIEAMKRYSDANLEIPQEWIDELSDLNSSN